MLLIRAVETQHQLSDFQPHVTNVPRTAQDKLVLFGYKQMPGQKEVIEMGAGKTP